MKSCRRGSPWETQNCPLLSTLKNGICKWIVFVRSHFSELNVLNRNFWFKAFESKSFRRNGTIRFNRLPSQTVVVQCLMRQVDQHGESQLESLNWRVAWYDSHRTVITMHVVATHQNLRIQSLCSAREDSGFNKTYSNSNCCNNNVVRKAMPMFVVPKKPNKPDSLGKIFTGFHFVSVYTRLFSK